MKFVLGKLLFNLGPTRVHRFADRGQNPKRIVFLANYFRQGFRSFMNTVIRTANRRVVNGNKPTQTAQIAFQSIKSGNSAVVGSSQIGVNTTRTNWKSILNRVIIKCSSDSWAAELRRNAAKKLMFGSGSTFALIGFSLSKEPTLLTNKDQLDVICQEIREAFLLSRPEESRSSEKIVSVNNIIFGDHLAKGCNAVIYSGKTNKCDLDDESSPQTFNGFDLAIKMMFNYDAESNATAIWRAMYRESIPAQSGFLPRGQFGFDHFVLPKHPNIVDMKCAFVDMVIDLPDALTLYPDALPSRLNSEGLGRNMTFYLVMKRYDCSLRSFLQTKEEKLGTRTCIYLLNQLLEGIVFLTSHGVSHRDLKSDNILLDLSYARNGSDNQTLQMEESSPLLVITDFGCCLADKKTGLKLPFPTYDVFRGGNLALMAPEVITAVPGRYNTIDYSKADLWAAGAIAYEILGAKNPFYKESGPCYLMSENYSNSNLPTLPPEHPSVLNKLVKSMLDRETKSRISATEAADVCQVLLHAPSNWLEKKLSDMPTDQEMIVWILALGGVTLYNQNSKVSEINPIEQLLRTLYMSRINFDGLKRTLSYIAM